MKRLLLSVIFVTLFATAVPAQTNYWPTNLTGGDKIPTFLPIPSLTPGEILTNVTADVVAIKGYAGSARNVPQSVKNEVYRRYGMDPKKHDPCEIDHLQSLELGGANTISNLWPQSYLGPWNAHLKDRLENHLHLRVAHKTMQLKEAQDRIRTNWVASYVEFNLGAAPVAKPSTDN